MSLGIYDRLWDLLEGACTELDLQLAHHTTEGGGDGNTYQQYIAALRKREQLKSSHATEDTRATTLEQLANFFSLHIPNEAHRRQLVILRKEASQARLRVNALVQTIALDDKI